MVDVPGFPHLYRHADGSESRFRRPLTLVVRAEVRLDSPVDDVEVLDPRGQPADPTLRARARHSIPRMVWSLVFATPPQARHRVRAIRELLDVAAPPDRVGEELDRLVDDLDPPREGDPTRVRMHVFLHDDGTASGGMRVLPGSTTAPRHGPDEPGALARARLARAVVDQLA